MGSVLMRWYVGTLADCEAYDTKVSEAMGYSRDVTHHWCKPVRHPVEDKARVAVHESIEPDEGHAMQIVESLSDDWFNTAE